MYGRQRRRATGGHRGECDTEEVGILRLVRPTGEILFLGEGTGRPKNILSSPEKAGGEVAERIFAEVFGS